MAYVFPVTEVLIKIGAHLSIRFRLFRITREDDIVLLATWVAEYYDC